MPGREQTLALVKLFGGHVWLNHRTDLRIVVIRAAGRQPEPEIGLDEIDGDDGAAIVLFALREYHAQLFLRLHLVQQRSTHQPTETLGEVTLARGYADRCIHRHVAE